MSFAGDRLYNGYLRRNMPTIVSRVRVREIIVHLPCLTTHDRENIEAKRETSGNYDGMVLLLDCLKRRENWPEQFIQALEACEHTELAAEIRREYESLQPVNSSSSASAPTTVVRAHVHPAPAANRLPVSENGGGGQVAAAEPAAALPAPTEAPALASPSVKTQIAAVSPPESISEPPTQVEAPRLPSTPPPSPEIQLAQVDESLLAQKENVPHQEPEENSESDSQDASGGPGLVAQKMGKTEAPVSIGTSPHQQHQVPHTETETSRFPDPLQTTAAVDGPQESPSLPPVNSDVSDGPFPTVTPQKPPVQDTTPPARNVPQTETSTEQTVIIGPQTEASSTSPESSTTRRDMSCPDVNESTLCFSKPDQLLSVQPENPPGPQVQISVSPVQPYSGNSERLQISQTASNGERCEAVSALAPCQENGIIPDNKEPEENHYESPNQSFEVVENVVQVTEVPSILNLDGQAPPPPVQIINGEPARGGFPESIDAAEDAVSGSNSHQAGSFTSANPAGDGVSAEPKSNASDGQLTRKYMLIGAGVGAFALLLAMKYKK